MLKSPGGLMKKTGFVMVGALTLLFTACSSVTPIATETIGFAGIVDGTASSPTLNGQSLVLSNASITQDGATAKASDLQPGMEIAGKGRSNGSSIVVESLEFEDRLKGQVDVVDTANGTLDVAGVRVTLDASAKIVNRNADGTLSDITLADVAVNDYIEVHGVPSKEDSVVAMYIVRKLEDNLKVEFRMHLRNLDSAAKTFTYGLKTYTVDFSAAEVRGNLVDNAMIRVRGVRDGLIIRAERVRFGNDNNSSGEHDEDTHGKHEVQGPISNLNETSKTFTLLDFTVDYSTAEVKGNLKEGTWVEVKGVVNNTTSTLQASRVHVEGESEHDHGGQHGGEHDGAQRKGVVDAIDGAAMTFTVAGVSFWVDSATVVENQTSHIAFADIQVGNSVEVKFDAAKPNADGSSYATKIEIKTGEHHGNEGESEFVGPVSKFDVTSQTFSVGSVVISVSGSTEYKDLATEKSLSAADFWSTNRDGLNIKVEGMVQDSMLMAREIKLNYSGSIIKTH
jgi:Domain of unknown function (DUF5666)